MGAGASRKASAEAPSAVKKDGAVERAATAKLAAPRVEPYGVLTDAQLQACVASLRRVSVGSWND